MKDSGYEITQENVDLSNKFSGIEGFRKFVKMMDSTKW